MRTQTRCRHDRRARRHPDLYPERCNDYLNNRHYNPTLGVFISVDPLVTTTLQPYIYGAANPATLSDPEGLCAWAYIQELGCYGSPGNISAADNLEARGYEPPSTSSAQGVVDPRPGAGTVRVNLFIPQREVCPFGVCAYGDNRSFDRNATLADSRAVIAIDFESGTIEASFNHSCNRSGCSDAYPVSILESDSRELLFTSTTNYVAIDQSDNGIDLRVGGLISVGPPFSLAIDGQVSIGFDSNGSASVTKSGNEFPAYEVYQDLDRGTLILGRFEARSTPLYLIDGPTGVAARFLDRFL